LLITITLMPRHYAIISQMLSPPYFRHLAADYATPPPPLRR
jgi:hypothetical protein